MTKEALYYNAIATGVQGSYAAARNIKAGHATWKDAFEEVLYYGVNIPDPAREAEALERHGIEIILRDDPEFPALLREISHPPFALYVRGAIPSTNMTIDMVDEIGTLGIVGTRRASATGKDIAREFSAALTRTGATIVSGLAFGIDAAAHEGCLAATGTTIAVFAGGLGNIYPHSNKALAEKILATGGTLVSEYPLGEAPLAYRFIERNRIVSGLSRGVLVVEAPEDSGALATARFALEQNRDVFVVPGTIREKNYRGSNLLIQQGAMLVTTPDDILENYGIDKETSVIKRVASVSGSVEEMLIMEALKNVGAPADVDKLAVMTKLEPRIINQALSFLILKDLIKETDAGYTL